MHEACDDAVPPQLIEDALERVLASRGFRGSARKSRFLKFVVQETQAGHADRIKAFTIAMDVFDRDQNFDPLLDPVVRIQAGRIRRCLEQYYLTEGAEDPVHITIPKGGYVPHFIMVQDVALAERLDNPAHDERPGIVIVEEGNASPAPEMAEAPLPFRLLDTRRRRLVLAGAGLAVICVLLLASVWFAVMGLPLHKQTIQGATMRGPSLMVLPIANGTGNPAQDVFADGFTEDLIGALVQFKSVFVFGTDTAFHHRNDSEPNRAGPGVTLDYVLKGSVAQSGDQVQISVSLINAKDKRYIWSNSYRGTVTSSNASDVRQDIAGQVAAALAQSNGVIYKEEVQASAARAPNALSSYECMLRTRQYWRQLNVEMHAQVRGCLERAIKTDPLYADAWAALAMVYVDEARLGFNPVSARPDPVSAGLQLAAHAVSLTPDNPLPYQAMGLAYWLHREPESSIIAYERALALAPNDSDILAELGRCYSLLGNWERGIPLIQQAFARNPDNPNWYRIIFALYHYVHGRYDEALAEARRLELRNVILSHVVFAMIYGQTGRTDDAAYEVGEILRLDPKYGDKAIVEFERRNIAPATIAKIVEGLQKAGLTISPQWASTDGR
ncbi:tetratricopeptide repeat protein [Azospirillum sp. sgz301742]